MFNFDGDVNILLNEWNYKKFSIGDTKEIQISFQFDQMLTGTAAESYAASLVAATRNQAISTSDSIYAIETSSN